MSDWWLAVGLVGLGTIGIKAAGPAMLGRRELPAWFSGVVTLLVPAVLAALVATQALSTERELVVDARLAGLAAAIAGLAWRVPTLVMVASAAAATAAVRLL